MSGNETLFLIFRKFANKQALLNHDPKRKRMITPVVNRTLHTYWRWSERNL